MTVILINLKKNKNKKKDRRKRHANAMQFNHLVDKNTLKILPNDNNESFHENVIHLHSEKVSVPKRK